MAEPEKKPEAEQQPTPAPAQAPAETKQAQAPAPAEPQDAASAELAAIKAALREEREKRRGLSRERDTIRDETAELRARLKLLEEERTKRQEPKENEFLRENANDPIVRELLSTKEQVQLTQQQLDELRRSREEAENAAAERWTDEILGTTERANRDLTKIKGLEGLFEKDDQGRYQHHLMLDFVDLVADKNITDDKTFKVAFNGFFHDHLVDMAAQEKARAQAQLKQDGNEAAQTVSAPGTAQGSTLAFGKNSDFVKRVQERLRSQGQ